jgi:hypothetical protein
MTKFLVSCNLGGEISLTFGDIDPLGLLIKAKLCDRSELPIDQ